MAKKTTASFNIDQSVSRESGISVFDRIIREIDANEIPAKYVDQILVQYVDGSVIELCGDSISRPIPLTKSAEWGDPTSSYKKMKDVRVFINTDILETDINILVEKVLGHCC